MELDKDEMTKVGNRLKRAQGQLAARRAHDRRGPRLRGHRHAALRGLPRAGPGRVRDHRVSGMRQCLVRTEADDATGTLDVAKLEKLFLSLA